MLGTDSPEVSGVAIQQKQNRGILMIQVPLDNLTKTRQYLAEKVLQLVQQYYTEELFRLQMNQTLTNQACQ